MKRNPEVDAWFAKCTNPLKNEMKAVREIILNSNNLVEEDIKWAAPNFKYNGNLCTFNPRAKKFVNLTFHTGSELEDPKGLLEGEGKNARVARFENMADINKKRRPWKQ